MLYSMTGFGKAVTQLPNKKITVEIKSLNSKQMDISARVPVAYRECELDMRAIIANRLERGKVDLTVNVEATGAENVAKINIEALAAYKKQIEEVSKRLSIPAPCDWYSVLIRFPDVLRLTDGDSGINEEEIKALLDSVKRAVEDLVAHRRAEGERLEGFFASRLDTITELLGQVPQYETERVSRIRERLTQNLEQIKNVGVDNTRLEQELFFYIEKLDINEEKQRLAQHIRYFRETIEQPGGQGKKLGFIAQEMGREINTLGSKSNHADLQRLVVRMKDALEQIKEQVLNVN